MDPKTGGAGAVNDLLGARLSDGVPLRFVTSAAGTGWVETWDGSAWVKGGSLYAHFAGRPMTDAELVRFGIVAPDPSKPLPRVF
jgi:hypothetical protein